MSKLLDFRSTLRAQAWDRASDLILTCPDLTERQDTKGRTLVGYAAQDGRWAEVDWLLGEGSSWAQAAHGWLRGGLTAPDVLEGDLRSKCLRELGASFTVAGESLLAAALVGGKREMVATLVQQEWTGDEAGWRHCWFLAIKRFERSTMDALQDGDVGAMSKAWMPELAVQAMSVGNFDALTWLCESGLDLGLSTGGGASLLCQAAGANNSNAVAWLLARGAPVDGFDGEGYSPLYRAVARGAEPVAHALLAAGANPELRQGLKGQGSSPLRLAKRQGARNMRQLLAAALEGVSLSRQTSTPALRVSSVRL